MSGTDAATATTRMPALARTLDTPHHRPTEETPGAREKHEHDEAEAEDLAHAGAEIPGDDRLEDAVEDARDDDAARALDPADDRDRERLEPDRRPHGRRDVEERREEDAGHAGEERAQRVRGGDRPVDVDAHEP